MGARCLTCSEKRRRLLKSVELFGGWMPMCFNCAGQVMHLDPLPTTIATLKEAVSRERRRNDRRFGKPDSRVFQYERRVGERRAPRVDDCSIIDDDMIIEISAQAAADDDYELDFEDQTRIRDLADLPS